MTVGNPIAVLRALLCAILIATLPCAPASAEPAKPQNSPQRIMSLNLCTDQLLLMLAPPERITSVTWLALDPSASIMVEAARRVPTNHGQAEEVLAQNPDLVLAGTFTASTTRALISRFNYNVVEVPEAMDFDGIRAVTRQVGAALGEPARAEELIAEMHAELAQLERRALNWRPRVVAWDGGGIAPGRGTLFDAILTAAGARNLAAEEGLDGFGAFDLEALLRADPDALVEGEPGLEAPSLRNEAARHALLRRHYAGRRVAVPQYLYACGTPRSARAARLLRDRLEELAPQ
jgi:iron complex transport system substrate-binding protein